MTAITHALREAALKKIAPGCLEMDWIGKELSAVSRGQHDVQWDYTFWVYKFDSTLYET